MTVVAAAFVVRLVYNLFVHPPLDYVTSDMAGYVRRATEALDVPWSTKRPTSTFFPYGTHVFVAGIRAVFGREARAPIGIAFAGLGAAAVGFAFALAQRLAPAENRRLLLSIFGTLLVVHVPLIMLGSFVLSEVPFSCALAAAVFYSVRFDDERRTRDAAFAGIAFALAMTVRPQVVVSLALMGCLIVARRWKNRSSPPAPTGRRVLPALLFVVPIAIVAMLSAHRVHHHTDRWGFVSTNGGFNLAFGRCHPTRLSATDTRSSGFEVPSLKHLATFQDKHGWKPIVDLDPAYGTDLKIEGEIWDESAARKLAGECMQRTGPLRQLKYSATHLLLLYAYNLPWPTKGVVANVWAILQVAWIPGLVVALFRIVRQPDSRNGLVAAQVFALLAVAWIFFGEARLRVPYDPFIMWLALSVYVPIGLRLRSRRRES